MEHRLSTRRDTNLTSCLFVHLIRIYWPANGMKFDAVTVNHSDKWSERRAKNRARVETGLWGENEGHAHSCLCLCSQKAEEVRKELKP